jgi:hypothetical protein
MRRSILLAALALGAHAAWAQGTTDPMPADGDGVVVEGTAEIGETVGDTDTSEIGEVAEVVDPGTDVIEDETDPGSEVIEEETENTGTDVVEEETDTGAEVVVVEEEKSWTDNRSPRGEVRGGHRGSVSTLAQAGLGRVFGKLRSQGYGDIQIEQLGGEIFISAARGGEVRHLVYEAATGALVSDVSAPMGIMETISSKLKKDHPARGKVARDAAKSERGGNGHGKGGSKGHGGSGGGSKGSGGSKGGGNGKGNGGGKNH